MSAITGVPADPELTRSAPLETPPPLPPPPLPPAVPSTYLAPTDPFPSALAELDLVALHVLHSRVCRQLEHEHLAVPDGPHAVTRDRRQELEAELDTRQCFLAPPDRAPAARPTLAADPPTVAGEVPATPSEEPPPARRGTADEPGALILDLGEVRAGDRIEVWQRGQRHCRGTVEQACPALGVVWVHEAGDGYRRMIQAEDVELRRHASSDAW